MIVGNLMWVEIHSGEAHICRPAGRGEVRGSGYAHHWHHGGDMVWILREFLCISSTE